MSALSVEPEPDGGYDWDEAVRLWEEADWPEGCKVEIIEGIVTVAPPPSEQHNDTADLVHRRLYGMIPEDWGVYQTLGLILPEASGLFVPDLAVVPRAALRRNDGQHVPADAAELVVEITSKSNANHDRIKKAHGYAKAGVPLYLLLDAWHSGRPSATLYGEPENGTYRVLESVEYGEKLTLPDPFGADLDTAPFPVTLR
ncbi:Uma2 family endonuclease [Streptomyces sp. GC420]|uniref:Uma2 family endonuclease n=1 Tax=Streptomyces sp. GC420 TaxID=2697568 RepID=UPI0014152AE0|nr:Uma2 family endonuclease [Streptomyces sp. GC420]NBM15230.1 Uma2 family endonuclease [Streptomyces sp. GC420]